MIDTLIHLVVTIVVATIGSFFLFGYIVENTKAEGLALCCAVFGWFFGLYISGSLMVGVLLVLVLVLFSFVGSHLQSKEERHQEQL